MFKDVQSVKDRLLAGLRNVPETKCWEWQRACTSAGYGNLRVEGRSLQVHRAMWMAFRGPIPDGMFILHSCDNRKCANIAHLRVGTAKDNTADKRARNRFVTRKGLDNHKTKLSPGQVEEIRRVSGRETQTTTAARFGVSQVAISKIQRGINWKHTLNG